MFDLPSPRHISTLRILLLAAYPGEGRFTQPTAAVQTWRPELVFMPRIGLSFLDTRAAALRLI
jgi:hypothetical protein